MTTEVSVGDKLLVGYWRPYEEYQIGVDYQIGADKVRWRMGCSVVGFSFFF